MMKVAKPVILNAWSAPLKDGPFSRVIHPRREDAELVASIYFGGPTDVRAEFQPVGLTAALAQDRKEP